MARVPGQRLVGDELLEVGQLAGLALDGQRPAVEDGHPGAVVAAVLQAAQPVEHHLEGLLLTDVPHDAAHAGSLRWHVGLVRRVFRRSFEHVEAYAADWSASNARALEQDGPLWVVLGDSAAQGVGASSHLSGYVGVVLERLGPPWRVVNLSVSGARTRDVVDEQWPVAAGIGADLVTAVVGGNDALRTKEPRWRADVADLCAALPPGAVVSTTARGVFERKTARVNALLRRLAAERGLLRGRPVGAHRPAVPRAVLRRLPPQRPGLPAVGGRPVRGAAAGRAPPPVTRR